MSLRSRGHQRSCVLVGSILSGGRGFLKMEFCISGCSECKRPTRDKIIRIHASLLDEIFKSLLLIIPKRVNVKFGDVVPGESDSASSEKEQQTLIPAALTTHSVSLAFRRFYEGQKQELRTAAQHLERCLTEPLAQSQPQRKGKA
ncbi:hypothetical protein MJT46_008925 [Ovis ammon polii x Ovis aries]|nr:hypothetical protein MJT46_008925 [Ovis ammon polii x Ovis aries]